MFNSVSKAGIGGGLVTLLYAVLPLLDSFFGIKIPESDVQAFATAIGTIIGFVLLVWGQIDRKDLKFGLLRKGGDN